jgi:thiol peroxidase
MAAITLKGNPVNTVGNLPASHAKAIDVELVKTDLSSLKFSDFLGTNLVLNIFPSIDTGTCAASVRKFNEKAAGLNNTKVICISRDLPFAQNRFCGAEGLQNVINASDFRTGEFGKTYGLEIIDGALKGLHSRVVIIIDKSGNIVYTEQVGEIVDEPNYDAALSKIASLA